MSRLGYPFAQLSKPGVSPFLIAGGAPYFFRCRTNRVTEAELGLQSAAKIKIFLLVFE